MTKIIITNRDNEIKFEFLAESAYDDVISINGCLGEVRRNGRLTKLFYNVDLDFFYLYIDEFGIVIPRTEGAPDTCTPPTVSWQASSSDIRRLVVRILKLRSVYII